MMALYENLIKKENNDFFLFLTKFERGCQHCIYIYIYIEYKEFFVYQPTFLILVCPRGQCLTFVIFMEPIDILTIFIKMKAQ